MTSERTDQPAPRQAAVFLMAVHGTRRPASRQWRFAVLGVAGCLVLASAATGQTVTQRIDLVEGWNAVHIHVQPEVSGADTLFSDPAIVSVWQRVPAESVFRRAPDQVATEAGSAGNGDEVWSLWLPPSDPHRVVSTLRKVRGNTAYLIRTRAATTLTVRGVPSDSATRWRRGFNLSGFHVVEGVGAKPIFARFLAPSGLHGDAPEVFALAADGTLRRLDGRAAHIRAGEAYWVAAQTRGSYDGPVEIDPATLGGVEFGDAGLEHHVRLRNLDDAEVTVRLAGSAGGSPSPWLIWELSTEDGSRSGAGQWRDLAVESRRLAPRGESAAATRLRIGMNPSYHRSEPRSLDAGPPLADVLEISTDSGYRRLVPVVGLPATQEGLWVGTVTVDRVVWITDPLLPPDPNDRIATSTTSVFTFRIIIHKGVTTHNLLREVVLAYDDNTQQNVLVTSECMDAYLGDDVPRPRVSTAAFSFDGRVGLTGDFDTELSVASSDGITIGAGDALNPYRHRMHPSHSTGLEIKRKPKLTFTGGGSPDPQRGLDRLSGDYSETITGLGRNAVQVEGTFELKRISNVATLCGE
jgi:hypothetical protein